MQKKLTVLFAFAIFVLVVGWAITPVQAHCKPNGPHVAHCNGDPPPEDGGANIRVKVDFRDASGDRLMSDCHEVQGDCPYINKVDKVVTLIRGTVGGKGNFAMHTSKFAIRRLFLDFSDCASVDTEECRPPFLPGGVTGQEHGFTPGPANLYTSGVNLGEMAEGEEIKYNLRLSVNIDLNSIDGGIYTLFFYPSFAGCPDSSPLSVTRGMGTEADTWVIVAGQNAVTCLAENVGAADYAFRGLYSMPFQMILQKM